MSLLSVYCDKVFLTLRELQKKIKVTKIDTWTHYGKVGQNVQQMWDSVPLYINPVPV